jgi:hypothetical protein
VIAMTGSVRTGWRAAMPTMVAAALIGVGVTSCSSGPATRTDVCNAYDDLGRQLMQGNGLIGNPLFHKADDLAGVAKRYQAADLSSDATALHRIAKSDSTSGMELMQATTAIADLCGHPLGLGQTVG